MDYDKTQPLSNRTHENIRQIFRCPCGNDVEIDPKSGGRCGECNRLAPSTVTEMSMTMTFSNVGGQLPADNSDADELIGTTLGHFEILEPIGSGGMGHVYRALDKSLQRYVAVKVIRGSASGSQTRVDSRRAFDTEGQQRLLHEAIAQARVNHPNIVTIYYVGREGEIPFLAMELIDGYDASDLIRQGEVPYETLCSIAIKITHALEVASHTGIIHSDIKPQNMLILKNGSVKLSDFGMATIGEKNRDKSLGGTPNYIAPELLGGEKPSIQSDMYSLGVTLYELTFGRLPVKLEGSGLQEWSETHESANVTFPEPWPDHLPEKWKVVLQRLLKKQPSDRYVGYAELGTDLNSILPVKRRQALLFARTIAWGIDVIIMTLMIALGVFLLATFTSIDLNVGNAAMLPGLMLHLVMVYFWRQSIGRELVHVKIVNQYSLQPTRKKMILREVWRMAFIIFIAVGATVGVFSSVAGVVIVLVGALFGIADVLYTATLGRGESLHDKFFRTQAVVGSDST